MLTEKPIAQLSSTLRSLAMSDRAKRVFLPFSDLDFLSRTFGATNPLAQSEAILNVDPTLLEMRLTKDTDEIQALREAIASTSKFPGVTGEITIDRDRNARKPAVVLEIKGGQLHLVETVRPE